MGLKDLKTRIGKERYDAIEALAKKLTAAGKNPDQVAQEVKSKFPNLGVDYLAMVIVVI
jgi:hypothetical protein